MGILTTLLKVIILVFAGGELFRTQLGRGLSITFLDVLVGIFSFLGIVYMVYKKKYMHMSYEKYVFGFVGIACISLLVNASKFSSDQLVISALYLLRSISYASIAWIVQLFPKKVKEEIIVLLLCSGLLVVIFGYVQYFLYQDLRNLFYLGWDDHLYRMFSTFFDPNFLGGVFVFTFLLLMYKVSIYYKKSEKKKMIGGSIGVMITALALLLTHSRGSFIMILISLGIFLFFSGKKLYIFVMMGIFVLILIILSPFFYIENINIFRRVSTEGRLETMKNAITIFLDHPLTGVGFNTYRYIQIEYGFRKKEGGLESHADAGVDNSFLFVLATTGIFGFLSYAMIFISILKKRFSQLYSISSYEAKLRVIVCIASLFGICVHGVFMNSLFYPHIMMWLWILVGVTERK